MSLKTERADVVISNGGTLQALEEKVERLKSSLEASSPKVEMHEAFVCAFLAMSFLHDDGFSRTLGVTVVKVFLMFVL